MTKTQSAGPISCLEHRATRLLHSTIVTRAAMFMFSLLLQSVIGSQMRPQRLRGDWFSRLLRHTARRRSSSVLSPGTHTGWWSVSKEANHLFAMNRCITSELLVAEQWSDLKWPLAISFSLFWLHRMHEMQTFVADDHSVCLSVMQLKSASLCKNVWAINMLFRVNPPWKWWPMGHCVSSRLEISCTHRQRGAV